MNKIFLLSCISISSLVSSVTVAAEQKMELNIYQVMQRVLDRYPSLKVSELEVAQAAEQKHQIESSLGWMLNSSAGVTHDLTALGTPSDRLDVNGALTRKLESGSTLSLSGGYRYEDSTLPLSGFPNPAHTTRLDLSYRLPLAQGEGNPLYNEGLISAEAGHKLAKANQLLTRITLAEKVKDLFYASAATQARLDNAAQSVERAKKLETYINKNAKLGLAEEKDQLQVRAQVHSKQAELSTIRLQWKQQLNSLNRLMLEDWQNSVKPVLISAKNNLIHDVNYLINLTRDYHPAVKLSQANIEISESKINSARDSQKDNLDLVLSVGSRTSDGKSTTKTVSERDWAGSVLLEYKHLFDEKGTSSKYKQALLDKHIALVNINKTNDDIRYTVSGLVTEINAAAEAVKSASKKLKSEALKLKESELRFRTGRADTAQLIQFQNEYAFAELSFQTQKIDLRNRMIALQIFTGQFWNKLSMKHGVKE